MATLTQHDLPYLDELESDGLDLELELGRGRALVHQTQLRVLRPLEEVEIPDKVVRVVDLASPVVHKVILAHLPLLDTEKVSRLLQLQYVNYVK